MTDLAASPLGRAVSYAETYDARLLYPVERAPQRAELPVAPPWPFDGADLWTAYEVSWLDRDGKLLAASGSVVTQTLCTRLFRSVCPVTGQPDYASVQIRYRGPRIEPRGLLAYLVSFRRHPGFHEHCIERVFSDIWQRCGPQALTVYARFTRRGGIDINPYRTSTGEPPPGNIRTSRQ
jgi:NADPH-dependent 7-cyano-7-deazaguanine reductase QueF